MQRLNESISHNAAKGSVGHVINIMSSDFHFLVPERFHTKFGSDQHSSF